MKKIIILALALMLTVCLATTAFAAAGDSTEEPLALNTGRNTVQVAAGASIYVEVDATAADTKMSARGDHMNWYIQGRSPIYPDMSGAAGVELPAGNKQVLTIVNADAENALWLTIIVEAVVPGTWNNPADMTLGSVTADVTAQGYYFAYTATEDGVLVVTPNGDNWTVTINNETTYAYGDAVYASDNVGFAACGMSAGDELVVILGTEDWTDATITFAASVVDHITELVGAADAECHTPGNIEHYYCQYCDGYFSDENATNALNEEAVFTNILGSTDITHNVEVPNTCHDNGVMEHWICNECGKYFENADCTIETSEWMITTYATYQFETEYVGGAEAGCHRPGNLEYWICLGCDRLYEDEWCSSAIEPEALIIDAEGELEYHEAVGAGCHIDGMLEYWYCAGCDCYFTDAEGIFNIARLSLVDPAETVLEHHEAEPQDCENTGMKEYWYCPECDCYFTDAEGKYNIARLSLVIPEDGHDFVDGECTVCGEPEESDNPPTGDMSLVLPILGVLMSSGATVAMITKKKEF